MPAQTKTKWPVLMVRTCKCRTGLPRGPLGKRKAMNMECRRWSTRYVRKVMRLIRENSFNWRYVYTHLIFFKITSLSINTPLLVVLPRIVARLEVLNWDLFQSIRHGSLHVFNSPKMVSFQAGFEPGKQKEIRQDSPGVLMLKDVILKNIKCV